MNGPESEFLWGAATSSHQIEGHNDKNDWFDWENQGVIEGGVKSGAATDHWRLFREDLRLAAELGLNSYRFSIEWSRLEPEEGHWDPAAFEWYLELLKECEVRGLLPMLTLHHFTSPRWFAERGGFTNEAAPLHFERFTREVVKRLGAHVPLWCTFNEPMVLTAGSYLGKFMPPGKFAPELASASCHTLLKSHVKAYETIHAHIPRRHGPWKDRPVAVGIAHNLLDFMPDRRWHPMEVLLTRLFWRFYNRAWLDAVTGRPQIFGIPGLIPKAAPVVEALGRATCDFIGVNYYTKAYVQWRPRSPERRRPAELPLGLVFARRKEPASDLDWAIHPKGFQKMLRFAARYRLPLFVTENGIADREDTKRAAFLRAHLGEIKRAVNAGLDIRGYYHWSLLDNFEWIEGFGPRFGLYAVDYDTFVRTPRESAGVYRDLILASRETQRDSRGHSP